jgi:death-on-curing protein
LRYLTVDEVIDIHEVTIEEHGGDPGILDWNLVDSAVQQAAQTFGGEPLYKTVGEVAAAYWHSITCNHGFLDGNKRTGAIAAAFFCSLNGHVLDMDDDKIIEVGLLMAAGGTKREDVFAIVCDCVKKANRP